ncbi:MAG: 6,7-dimethyl-8-ribityllumazine synthase [Gammaproteobacteria bacterium]|nr:6,7-dimethyl-8-ribityllumazine synthase [Rhodocyclaceae bacterium]MBU3909188.1 6,7-dimethyl-8-ribityllumazine synthase [Gammaproteobacteria bacterium]MBU3990000.1 6,7-dimethyl-8-ribityllumazine synthase [Gammaproteobacteria bacterium]MBU4005652.1 6,7-dimethyl-8-ribityllumazine synthase [Gammaproteobacteria bacterium]MBU4020795.1 6,7-dimethyl-8-ribityllumazine synthase [Gammaproteobacteria bacterium]
MTHTPNTSAPAPSERCADLTEIESDLSGTGLTIGVVMARFNREVGEGLLAGCCQELRRLGVAATDVTLVNVPGALEIPLTLQTMAQSGKFKALVALGCVIRGETYHFEIVSNEAARGVTDVQLTTGIPIANAVLTVENDDQALVRMHQKGMEAAQCAVEMANLLKAVK